MLNKNFISRLVIATIIGFLMSNIGCDTGTGIEPSLDPGILRITLESNPLDTSIVIVNNTFNISQDDSLGIKIFQGKAYNDTVSAILYTDIESYKQEEKTYNIIRRDSTGYKRYTIFESFVPPFDYDRIQLGITSNILQISDFDAIDVQSPENASLFVDLYRNFHVNENDTTEINVQIKPFQSISRYRDSYQFIPKIVITNVIYH